MDENAVKCCLLMDVSTLSTSSTGTGDSCVEFTGRRSRFAVEKVDQALVTRCKHTRKVRDGADCQAEVEKAEGRFGLDLGNLKGSG